MMIRIYLSLIPSLLTLIMALTLSMMPLNVSADEAKNAEQQALMIQILSTQNTVQIKKLAKQLYQEPTQDQLVLDKIADLIVESYQKEQLDKGDTIAWLCRAIGASRHGRYYTLLLDVKRHGAHKKVRKYAKIGLKQLGYATADQYLTH
jgi:hypothetical protein